MQWKMGNWKYRHDPAEVENAGVENPGVNDNIGSEHEQ